MQCAAHKVNWLIKFPSHGDQTDGMGERLVEPVEEEEAKKARRKNRADMHAQDTLMHFFIGQMPNNMANNSKSGSSTSMHLFTRVYWVEESSHNVLHVWSP
jgi:hypothetical protein